MTATPDQVIAQIREALEAGPYEGPWTVEEFQHDGRPSALIVSAEGTIIAEIRGYIDSCGNGENARFIAACNPQNIAVLLAERDALRKALELSGVRLKIAADRLVGFNVKTAFGVAAWSQEATDSARTLSGDKS